VPDRESLNVAWLGNLANVGFNYVSLLNRGGIEASLYMARNRLRNNASGNPENEYPGAAAEPFVHCHNRSYVNHLLNRLGFLGRLPKHERRIARTCQLVQAQTCREIAALRICRSAGIPYAGLTTGSDLSEVAFGHSRFSDLYRQSLSGASHIFLVNSNQVDIVERLPFELVSWSYLPLRIDLESIVSTPVPARRRLRIYSMARLDWTSSRTSIKANDVFLRGYARYVRQHGENDFEVLVRDWGVDRAATRALVSDLGIADAVQFVPAKSRADFLPDVADSDIVVDQFGLGTVGLAALEAMAVGRPVIAFCNQDWARRAYGEEVPVVNCADEAEVCEQLKRLNPAFVKEQGRLSNAWVRKYHSDDRIFGLMHSAYMRILGRPAATTL
jgi:glycosyltransferase involved in cell wall biosynthesis